MGIMNSNISHYFDVEVVEKKNHRSRSGRHNLILNDYWISKRFMNVLICSIISITLCIPIFYTNYHIPIIPQQLKFQTISTFRHNNGGPSSHHVVTSMTRTKTYPKMVILNDDDVFDIISSLPFKMAIIITTKYVHNINPNSTKTSLKFYNNLTISFNFVVMNNSTLSTSLLVFERYIHPNDEIIFQKERNNLWHQLDIPYVDKWYGNTYDDYDHLNDCVRPLWSYSYYPSCNDFHNTFDSTLYNYYSLNNDNDNLTSTTSIISFLGEGYYRQSWSFISNLYNETLVMKHLRHNKIIDYNQENFEKIKAEALLMEMGSESIISIYGHCGYSTIIEYGYDISHQIIPHHNNKESSYQMIGRGRMKQDVLNQLEKQQYNNNPYPMNNLTVDNKLNIAISMAISLSELHGFKYGTVIHQDVHIDQWLQTIDGRIVLNDMNNAEFLRWNYTNQNYCKYQCYYNGPFHSPEEYMNGYIDESADIYPIGNLIFSLITGLYPYYTEYKHKIIQNYILNSTLPYYNPLYNNNNYTVYQKMLQIMKLCYERNPIKRINIFQIIQLLKDI